MIETVKITLVLVGAYLLGSIPTALLMSRRIKQVDIRTIGDGNMGARNLFHTIGPRHAAAVALIDVGKGAAPVLAAVALGLSPGWQFVTGIAAIAGHDFPIFAGLRGGQGTATSIGTMLVLFPVPTLIGLGIWAVLYLFVRNFNISMGFGMGGNALILAATRQWPQLAYAIGVLLFIPIKLLIDSPRRRAITASKSSHR